MRKKLPSKYQQEKQHKDIKPDLIS